jgi:hypothetical protein|nr:MAG TPA: hypothetical protein [Caudoviricetes sp.]
MLKEKEMICEIANLIIQRVNFSEIDFENQPIEVTKFGNYRIFRGYQTDDLVDAKLKKAIYEVCETFIDCDFSGEVKEILEMYDYFDYTEKDEIKDFPKEFYISLITEILDNSDFLEQVDSSIFDY